MSDENLRRALVGIPEPFFSALIEQFKEAQIASLRDVDIRVLDLPGIQLGQALGRSIIIDSTAAGFGWFIDATPADNEEFGSQQDRGLVTDNKSPAAQQIDLLTVVLHEMGHVLGLDDHASTVDPDGFMNGRLDVGIRRLPTADDLAALLAGI